MKKYLFAPFVCLIMGASPAISFNYDELTTTQLENKIISKTASCAGSMQSLHPTKQNKADCIENGKMFSVLKKRNICWGPTTKPNSEKDWMKCSDRESEDFPFQL